MNGKIKYRILVFSIFLVLMFVGIYIGLNVGKNNEDKAVISNINDKQNDAIIDDAVSVAKKDEKKYDIEIIYKDCYVLCGHTITNKNMVYGTTISELKENEIAKQKQEKKEYKIESESNESIVFTRNLDQNCPNHFLVKLENGNVVIYNVVNDTVKTIFKKLEIHQDTINPELVEELNIGIRVDSKEELNLIIEDIES